MRFAHTMYYSSLRVGMVVLPILEKDKNIFPNKIHEYTALKAK
jgi:hypothetical protein